jgi:tetratricopeptide (TPR) repeat protein
MSDFEDGAAHGPTGLLHLLTCATCRSWAIRRLLDRQRAAAQEEETQDELYAGAWERLEEHTPELIEETRRRAETEERLFAELMQAPPGRRLALVRQVRFRSLDLLERLLEESHAGQLAEPARAAELARLAARLAGLFGEGDEEAAAALPRAYSLGANARRLEGRLRAADTLLAKAAPFLTGRIERAFYCRTLALLRWEQGRADEAQALLQHAMRLYGLDGMDHEVGACMTILGLMLLEEEGRGDPLDLLARGWVEMDRDLRPHLALRGGLALAASLAQRDEEERARGVLKESWRLFSQVTDPAEMLRVYAWEGRVLARLGEREEAMNVLESVRRQLLAKPSPAEAALVSLDLALVLAERGKAEEIEPLAEALWSSFPEMSVMLVAAQHLSAVAILAREGEPRLREAIFKTAFNLRRMFRACGLRIKPLPFA